MRPDAKRLAPILFVIIAALLTACRSQPTLAPNTAPGIGVGISSDECPHVEVDVGQQVTWTNTDSHEHTVRHKPEDGDMQFDAGVLQPGDSFAFLFVEAGTYLYECSEAGGVNGTVIVHP